jgi:ubiquinone/menaquinone biosynthesis C-methylase UbiE
MPKQPGRSVSSWTRFKRLKFYRLLTDVLLRIGRSQTPRTFNYDQAKRIHRIYDDRSGYGFDEQSKKERANNRLESLKQVVSMEEVKCIAELGGGDGQLALLLSKEGFRVSIVDVVDWRDQEVKDHSVPFVQVENGTSYNLPSQSVDLFISYNTIEHIPDPASSLREMIRITKPGGSIYLHFAPLYNSPWGLHVFSSYRGPYPQFTIDRIILDRFIKYTPIHDLGKSMENPQFVNGWSYARYKELFFKLDNRFELRIFRSIRNFEEVPFIFRNIACFWGRDLSYKDLTIEGLEILIKRL